MDLDFLRSVWRDQNPEAHHTMYLGTLGRGQNKGIYADIPLAFGVKLPWKEQPPDHDLFFAPNLFTGARKNENMVDSYWLYADLDGAPYPEIVPTCYWETSQGNSQAMWLLETPVNQVRHATLNKALTALTGADVGGWHASKLLRVPKSYNYKRGCAVSDVKYQAVSYDTDPLGLVLAPYIVHTEEVRDDWEPQVPTVSSNEALLKYWDRIGLLSRSMLMRSRSDRSHHIVMTVHQLLSDGFHKQEVFDLIWPQSWNKWRTDGERPHMLAREITRAKKS